MKANEFQNQSGLKKQIDQRLTGAIELLIRMFGLVNGTITIHARGGQISRAIEVVNKLDVSQLG